MPAGSPAWDALSRFTWGILLGEEYPRVFFCGNELEGLALEHKNHWVILGILLGLSRSRSASHCWGCSLSLLFLVSFFPPRILYSDTPSEPAATAFLKTDLVQTPVFIIYGRYQKPNEWGNISLRPFLLCTFGINISKLAASLPESI